MKRSSPVAVISIITIAKLVGCLGLAPTTYATQVSPESIEVFEANNPETITTRGGADDAIDGDVGTFNYLTPAFTQVPQIAALDLATTRTIGAIRIAKGGDTDGAGAGWGAPGLAPIDNMDLTILFTNDDGPLNERSYAPVAGLRNSADEPIEADSVNPATATIDNDHHHFADHGWYTLEFNDVSATAIGIRFARDREDTAPWTHYLVFEVELTESGELVDEDDDGLPDKWEESFATLEVLATGQDVDGDGLKDEEEFAAGTNPTKSDTDGDSLSDHEEVHGTRNPFADGVLSKPPGAGTNPVAADSDGDGIQDAAELTSDNGFVTDPNAIDTDDDDLTDLTELTLGTNPTIADTDGDGVPDGLEVQRASDPLDKGDQPLATVEIVAIEVFEAEDPSAITTRNRAERSIDGSLVTFNYLTPAFTEVPNIVALDLGGSEVVGAIRVAKRGDTDSAGSNSGAPGIAPIDHMDLQILFTTDDGALNERNYAPVSGLASSPWEPINADAVDPGTGAVDNDHHDFDEDGWYTLTFNPVSASALAIRFERDAEDSARWTHYPALEIEALAGTLAGPRIVSFMPDFATNNAIFEWDSQPGESYILMTSTNLQPDSWVELDDSIPSGGSTTTHELSLPAAKERYFRVQRRD